MIIFSLLEQCLIHVPLLLGAYISFSLLKMPDLSIESAYTFGAFCAACFIGHFPELHPFLQLFTALCISFVAGGIVGGLSSGLTTLLQISHLLATIITGGVFYSINQYIIGSYYSISSIQSPLNIDFVHGHPEFLLLAVIGIVIICIVSLFLKTEIGFCIVGYGINKSFFKHYSISSPYIFIVGTIIANSLAGVSGYLQAQANGFVDITMGLNKSLFCVTALIFGKIIVNSSSIVHAGHVILGGGMYFFVQYGLVLVGCESRLFTLMQAIAISTILAVRTKNNSGTKHSVLGI